MSGREAILNKVRGAIGSTPALADNRAAVVAQRLDRAPSGVLPGRAVHLPPSERIALFCERALSLAATVERVPAPEDVPTAIAGYLRERNLPASFRMGADPRLVELPWDGQPTLDIRYGPSDGNDEVGVSQATAGIAETGTIALVSGKDNPTTINFLPDHHIVVVEAGDVEPTLEGVLARVRERYGKGLMPRTLNFVSGPSRSGDVEQKLVLGAHGPRALHLIVVGEVR